MLDEREKTLVAEAIGLIGKWKDRECYCNEEECTPDNPQCTDMQEVAALRCLEQLQTPPVTTRHPERLTNPAERIYFEAAQKLGERSPGLNDGYSTLEHVLNPNLRSVPPVITTHEAEIAATLIQWLGTTCGRCFMDECERKINSENAERRDWHLRLTDFEWFLAPSSWCDEQANLTLNHLLPPTDKHFAGLVKKLSARYRRMMIVLAVECGYITTQDAANAAYGNNITQFKQFMERARAASKTVANECLGKKEEAVPA